MRILNVKDSGVTQGVINEDFHAEPLLREVTFTDYQGIPHTVFAHTNGPFETADDIVRAWYHGELHTDPIEEPPAEPEQPQPQQRGY